MKRLLPRLLVLFIMLSGTFMVQKGYSQALLIDNFDVSAGTLLTAAGWTAHSSGGTNSIDVVVPGLSFTGYPLTDIGGAAAVDNTGEDVSRTFTAQTSGTVYAAFMIKVDASAAGYFMHFGGNPIGTTFRGKLFLIGTSEPYNFGLSVGSNTATPITDGSFSYGTTYLAVLKYEVVDGTTNDIVSFYLISGTVPSTEPATPSIGPLTDASQGDINPGSIALRQFSSSQNITIDGLRIATTWEEAVTAAMPVDTEAPVFTSGYPAVANIDETQADLQVNMDEPGTAYYVVLTDGATAPTAAEVFAGTGNGGATPLAAGTIDVLAASTTYSATITGLTDKTDYDIYVVAQDDESTPNQQTDPVLVNLYTIRPPDVLYSADFTSSLDPFTPVSVTGDQVWYRTSYSGNYYAYINGYSGGALDNVDCLISPAINLDAAESIKMSFKTATDYDGPTLKVLICSNLDDNYTPEGVMAAAWSDITPNFSLSTDAFEWTSSGEFSLSGYSGKVYIAFVYESSPAAGAAAWEMDDFLITGYLLPGSDASLTDIKVDDVSITGFDPATLAYTVVLEAGVTTPPTVTYTLSDEFASAVVTNATDLTGDAAARTTSIVVTASNTTTEQTYTVRFDPIIAVADLAALRAVSTDAYDRIYQVTGEVVVSGLNATNRNQKYIQDASAGVLIDDSNGTVTTAYNVGDGITGFTGTLYNYYDMLEFIPYRDPGTANSTGNTLTAQTVTVTEFTTNFESYEAELVQIVGLAFAAADGTAIFAIKTNYNVTAGTDATVVRTVFLVNDITGTVIPYMADVTGIAVWDYSTAKIAPRTLADLNIYSSDATLSDLKVSGTTVTGFAASTLTYNVSLAAGTTTVPTVTATTTDANATYAVTPATSLTGDAAARTTKVDVTSQDKSATKQYTVVFTVATAIDDTEDGELVLFPVPAQTDVTILNGENVSLIEIFDVTGNKHITLKCYSEPKIVIPLNQLSRGIYFVRFTTSKGIIMKRLVKN